MIMHRSNDGLTLLMTSSDGFCSTLTFSSEELGQVYVPEPSKPVQTTSLSALNTPIPTPTASIAPPFPNISNGQALHQRTPSNPLSVAPSPPPNPLTITATGHPSSPTRSNSTSSIATQSSIAPQSGIVISNPPLVAGSVPSITATTSNFVSGMSMTTPPQTPSTTSSVSGVKRDAGTASESDREDVPGQSQPSKKRRIAPTLVSDGTV